MDTYDIPIVRFVNQFSQRSHVFDLAVYHFFWNNMLKGGILSALVWWVWFQRGKSDFSVRARLTSTIVFSVLAVAVARGMALLCPYRSRPFHTPSLGFKLTFGMSQETLEHWSSFPSDHAALFFTLATGLYCIERRIGCIALAHTFVFICLPRLYLGVHYPTDLLAGAMIGIGMGWCACRPKISLRIYRPAALWRERHEGSFYAVLFLVTYQIADLFEHTRGILSAAIKALTKQV